VITLANVCGMGGTFRHRTDDARFRNPSFAMPWQNAEGGPEAGIRERAVQTEFGRNHTQKADPDRNALMSTGCALNGLNGWCREGESIPAILKGTVKIPPIQAKCNIDAGLHGVFLVGSKSGFWTISGDLGQFRHTFY
jgi:hypothetical protein